MPATLPKCNGRSSLEIQTLQNTTGCATLFPMNWKIFLPLLPVLLLAGCTTATFTRLTPDRQPRNANNLYPVEVAFDSNRQAIRWDSIKPYVIVNGEPLPLNPVPMVEHRWEGLVPVPPAANSVSYRFKFDYLYNNFGTQPQPNSEASKNFTLKISEQ
ncbi:MAG TPA: hypothetical protein VIK53_17400 [Verrucomicrobiae bacterium]